MDAMEEAAEVQPAKRVRSDTHVGSACNAACDIVIIDQQDFQHRKSDLQTLRRQVICRLHIKINATICNPIDSLLYEMTSKAAGLLQYIACGVRCLLSRKASMWWPCMATAGLSAQPCRAGNT